MVTWDFREEMYLTTNRVVLTPYLSLDREHTNPAACGETDIGENHKLK